jgi:hypothetical protein
MKMQTPAVGSMAISADKKIDDVKLNFWFRAGIFALSVAGGILFTRLLHTGFSLLPSVGDGAADKASPLVAVLKMLHSGLGN